MVNLLKRLLITISSKGTGSALTLSLSEVEFATIGAVNNFSGTAKLLKCK